MGFANRIALTAGLLLGAFNAHAQDEMHWNDTPQKELGSTVNLSRDGVKAMAGKQAVCVGDVVAAKVAREPDLEFSVTWNIRSEFLGAGNLVTFSWNRKDMDPMNDDHRSVYFYIAEKTVSVHVMDLKSGPEASMVWTGNHDLASIANAWLIPLGKKSNEYAKIVDDMVKELAPCGEERLSQATLPASPMRSLGVAPRG